MLSAKIVAFLMVLTRLGAFFAASPLFGWQVIPLKVKLCMAIVAAVFFAGLCPYNPAAEMPILQMVLLLANEAIYGLALGFVAYFIFAVVKLSAHICEREMGLAMAQILDPLTGEEAEPFSMLMEFIFILMFLNINSHHLLLATIGQSYASYPPGSIPEIAGLASSVAAAGSAMLFLALKMAVPMLTAFLILLVVLAIVAKVAPEMEILFLSMPLRIGLGLLMAAVFLPLVNNFIEDFAHWLSRLMVV